VQYISTRDSRPRPEALAFDEVLLAGLARDGGLYVPASWPRLEADALRALRGRSYAEIALAVVAPFIGDTIERGALKRLIERAYAGFGHAAVAP
jgi:threonine synthase